MLALEGVDVAFGEDPVLLDVDLVVMRGERVGVVGPNGAGKTVLARVLAGDLEPGAGRRWAGDGIDVGYLSQAAAGMDPSATVLDALRAGRSLATDEAVRRLMAFRFDYEQVRRAVATLSGGERTRLAFLALMLDAPNCLVLDEPTNHLDVDSIEVLEDALEHYDGTVIAVSHDRYFLDRIADRIVHVADGDGARLRGRLVGERADRRLRGFPGAAPMGSPIPWRRTTERAPDGPTDLPKRSWMDTLKRTFREFKEDNLTDWAAALTYYSVLSIFPALIALISIVGLVADPATITRVLTDTISQLGPSSAVEQLQGPIQEITANSGKAGLGLIIGLAGALWTASGYVGAFMRASNAIYEIEEGRPFYKLRPLQILVTLILELMLAIVVLGLIVSGPLATAIGNAVGIGDTALTIFNIAKWPVLLVIVSLMLAILYYSAPNAKLPGFKWISPGSVRGRRRSGSSPRRRSRSTWRTSAPTARPTGRSAAPSRSWSGCGSRTSPLLFGAELNAELERSRELEAGEPAEHEIQLPPRIGAEGQGQGEDRLGRGGHRLRAARPALQPDGGAEHQRGAGHLDRRQRLAEDHERERDGRQRLERREDRRRRRARRAAARRRRARSA